MKIWTREIVYLFMSFALILLSYLHNLEACESTDNKNYSLTKDALGRLIVLRIDLKDRSLQISIDGEPSKIISMPDQKCFDFYSHATPEGDIVIFWMGLASNQEICSIYITALPYGKEWTQPERLSAENEYIISKSLRSIVTTLHDITVFWESAIFFESTQSITGLGHQRELRTVRGGMNSWSQPSTCVILSNSDELNS